MILLADIWHVRYRRISESQWAHLAIFADRCDRPMKSLGVLPALSSFNLEEMSHGKYGFRSLIYVQQITYCLVPWETVNFVFP